MKKDLPLPGQESFCELVVETSDGKSQQTVRQIWKSFPFAGVSVCVRLSVKGFCECERPSGVVQQTEIQQ